MLIEVSWLANEVDGTHLVVWCIFTILNDIQYFTLYNTHRLYCFISSHVWANHIVVLFTVTRFFYNLQIVSSRRRKKKCYHISKHTRYKYCIAIFTSVIGYTNPWRIYVDLHILHFLGESKTNVTNYSRWVNKQCCVAMVGKNHQKDRG